jgi:light-regulated signal transduction histidine kinase (bacteriophytochrome)
MNQAADNITLRHLTLLRDYLENGKEEALDQAYGLGRDAMVQGMGILDMLQVHRTHLMSLLQSSSDVIEAAEAFSKGNSLLPEMLSPFEMSHRGFQEVSSNLQRLNQTLAQRVAELGRANTDLERFAYLASHDLQEPLRMISAFAQLLSERYSGRLDPDADEFIAFMVDSANRMRDLINGLLSFSRVQTQGKPLTPVPAEEAFRRALANLQVTITESQAQISHDPLPLVLADPTQLMQVFQNLIANAIKFCSQQVPTVHVSAQPADSEWLFSVQDNGIGIDPQFHHRIFEIFQRLHGRTEYSGTGMGLALCQRIVERHGGRIWVESALGQGATFYFTLPLAQRTENVTAIAKPAR